MKGNIPASSGERKCIVDGQIVDGRLHAATVTVVTDYSLSMSALA